MLLLATKTHSGKDGFRPSNWTLTFKPSFAHARRSTGAFIWILTVCVQPPIEFGLLSVRELDRLLFDSYAHGKATIASECSIFNLYDLEAFMKGAIVEGGRARGGFQGQIVRNAEERSWRAAGTPPTTRAHTFEGVSDVFACAVQRSCRSNHSPTSRAKTA